MDSHCASRETRAPGRHARIPECAHNDQPREPVLLNQFDVGGAVLGLDSSLRILLIPAEAGHPVVITNTDQLAKGTDLG
jgi:hypothetical protein